jgi:hypothetical protein
VEIRVHRLQTFKMVQQDTAALKDDMNALKRQLELMGAAARKSEEKVAMLISTLKEIQDNNVCFGQDLKDIGLKLTPTLDVELKGLPVLPPSQEGLPTRDALLAGRSVGVGLAYVMGRYDSFGQDGFDTPTDTHQFVNQARDHQ